MDWMSKLALLRDRPYATANYEQIEVDPTNPDIVYLGANYWTTKDGVYKTTNGGIHGSLL